MNAAMIAHAWRTPLGRTVDEVMARLYAGERAAIPNPNATSYAVTVAAPILGAPARSRHDRFLRRMGQYAMEVAREALAASGIAPGARVGLFSGVGGLRAHWDDMLAALAHQHADGVAAWERGLRDVHPYWMLRHLSNNVHALASVELGLRGEGATFGGGTGGAQAIASATRALDSGAIDAAVVIAYDSLLEPETLVELGARPAATHAAPGDVVAPYDPRAAGFVPGEAAAAIVLVRSADGAPLASAQAVANQPPPMMAADLVDGAAIGWPDLDAAERATVTAPLTAITAAMGQLGAATSVVQAIALAEMLRRKRVAPVAGLTVDLPGVVTRERAIDGRVAIGLATSAPDLAAMVRVEVGA